MLERRVKYKHKGRGGIIHARIIFSEVAWIGSIIEKILLYKIVEIRWFGIKANN